MINQFQKLKTNKLNRGMTYIELIVVLSIFSSLSAVVVFNYNEFQARVDIKNLSSDIALKVVEAQKFSVSGRLPPLAQQAQLDGSENWKPSYGIYIDRVTDDKSFYFFTDLDQDGLFDTSACPGTGECLDNPVITKGNNFISGLSFYNRSDPTPSSLDDLTITFVRPSGSAILSSTDTSFDPNNVDYVQITVESPKGATANIKIYSSGNIDLR